ncbi:MAG: OPT/YSL family transporter [Candidatus Micrarchaeia archaeon]
MEENFHTGLFKDIRADVVPLLLGGVLSIIVALYSAYAGLTIGGVYWPVITTSLVSAAVLGALGVRDHDKINVMQTAGSTGGLLAAGVIFTLPAAYMLGIPLDFFQVTASALLGGGLGIALSAMIRKNMIETEKLPYPDALAASKVINASTKMGGEKNLLFASFGIAGLFAIARDRFGLVPSYFNLDTLKLPQANLFSLGSSISMIPIAGGFLIGTLFSSAWFAGAFISNIVLVPYLAASGAYASKAAALAEFAKPAGVAVVIGAGAAYFLLLGIKYAKAYLKESGKKKAGAEGPAHVGHATAMWAKAFVILAFAVLMAMFDFDIVMSLLALVFAIGMAILGGRVTGEMNVDPMEIFAMIAIVLGKVFLGFAAIKLVLVAAVVCTSAGIAGDMMQDYKVGSIVGTKPRRQLIAQIVGLVFAVSVMYAIMASFATIGYGTMKLPSPQATAIKGLISLDTLSAATVYGLAIGFVLTLLLSYANLAALPIAIGIGMYVPIELSVPIFIGGLARAAIDRAGKTDTARIIASGVIAGEGIVGAALILWGAATVLGL